VVAALLLFNAILGFFQEGNKNSSPEKLGEGENMIRHQLFSLLAVSLSLFAGSMCVTKPIAKQYREEAKAEDLTFAMVLQDPDAYVGNTVLWGGDIIATANTKEGTRIVVLETPLNWQERPESAQGSQGRFIAMSAKFLDPAIYKKGRKITMAGVVAGKEALPLGNMTYTYPVVTVKQLHLWERRPHYVNSPYWGLGPYWGWGPPFGYFGDFDEGFGHEEEEEAERGGDRK
jgi:outer membrane lipoprotein